MEFDKQSDLDPTSPSVKKLSKEAAEIWDGLADFWDNIQGEYCSPVQAPEGFTREAKCSGKAVPRQGSVN